MITLVVMYSRDTTGPRKLSLDANMITKSIYGLWDVFWPNSIPVMWFLMDKIWLKSYVGSMELLGLFLNGWWRKVNWLENTLPKISCCLDRLMKAQICLKFFFRSFVLYSTELIVRRRISYFWTFCFNYCKLTLIKDQLRDRLSLILG